MGDWFQEYRQQLKELWQRLNKRARIIIMIGVVSVVLLLAFIVIWNGNQQYQPLFARLTPGDADAIVKKLDEQNIPYTLADDGTTIMVPADVVYKTRLDMAGAGLPSQGQVGFEIFDQSSFGTTDFERKVNYYRALGGELSRSIQAIDGVEFARVQVTAPKESLFIDEERPAEASVLLKLSPGYRMSDRQIRAVSTLVASSVQNLNPDRVTIVDTDGNLLTAGVNKNGIYSSGSAANRYTIENQFAAGLKSDLQAMLTRVLGPDNFSVHVRVALNFDQREVESKEYTPVNGDEGIVRSHQEQKEKYSGTGQGGVPGTTSNLPQYQAVEGEDSGGTYESSDIITNYEINEKIERQIYAPGDVKRLSVAVIINETLQPENREKIEDAVQAAIGYNPERGDVVTVTGLAFDESLENEIAEAQAAQAAVMSRNTYIYAGLIILIIIILVVLFVILKRSGGPVEQDFTPGRIADFTVDEKVEEEAAVSEEEIERRRLEKSIVELVTERPDEVAQILKSWLMEE